MCEKPPSRRCQRRPLIRKIKYVKKAVEEDECEQPKCIQECVQPKCIQECEQPQCIQECKQPECIQDCEQPECIQDCEQPTCIQECVHTKQWEIEQEDENECGQVENVKFRLVGMSRKPNGIELEMEGMDSEECLCTVNESQEFRVTSSFSTVGTQSRTEPGFSAGEFFHKILDILRVLKSWTKDKCQKVQNAVAARQGPQVYYFPSTNDFV